MKKTCILVFLLIPTLLFAGCQSLGTIGINLKESVSGLGVVVHTYAVDGSPIDTVIADSVSIRNDSQFDTKDLEGQVVDKGSVVSLTIGGEPMEHVGDTLISHDKSISNLIEDYPTEFEIINTDNSVPFINRVANDFKEVVSGHERLILIRSQHGVPIGVFYGSEVSIHATSVNNSTMFNIDGKSLFVYRCSYTVYSMKLLNDSNLRLE